MIDIIKTHLLELSGADEQKKWHHTREFLQILVLKIMSDEDLFKGCSFVGGTCSRILFTSRRFSEDLDFSAKNDGVDIEAVKRTFGKKFSEFGIDVELKVNKEKVVQMIDLRFPKLFFDLGLSPLKDQKLRIKWDVDTHPPDGAQYTVTPMMKFGMMFAVDHYGLPSLFAGKLHACLFRTYLKGRDWYDLLWFLTRGVKPNLVLLNNAALQTQDQNFNFDMNSLKGFLLEKIQSMDFKKVSDDVERFLDDPHEVKMFQKEFFEMKIEKMSVEDRKKKIEDRG